MGFNVTTELHAKLGVGSAAGARGLAGLRDDAPNSDQASLVWRAPEGPEGTGGLRGAAPNEVRSHSLAGRRALRRPEHPWCHKQPGTPVEPQAALRNWEASRPTARSVGNAIL